MRSAIYARYSSDNQRDASIEDQVRLCRARIDSEGWRYLQTYADRAKSGATTLRPGYQKLLEGGRPAGSLVASRVHAQQITKLRDRLQRTRPRPGR